VGAQACDHGWGYEEGGGEAEQDAAGDIQGPVPEQVDAGRADDDRQSEQAEGEEATPAARAPEPDGGEAGEKCGAHGVAAGEDTRGGQVVERVVAEPEGREEVGELDGAEDAVDGG